MRFFQNTKSYPVLLSHPSGRGTVTIPWRGWVEGDFFARYPFLQEGALAATGKVVFSETEYYNLLASKPVVLPPIVEPHRLSPVADVTVVPAKDEQAAVKPPTPDIAREAPKATQPQVAPMAETKKPAADGKVTK